MFDLEDPRLHINLIIGTVFAALLWELFWPRRATRKGLGFRWLNNIGLGIVDQLAIQLIRSGTLLAAAWYAEQSVPGLLSDSAIPWFAKFLIVVLLLDFVAYSFHILQHRYRWLWRFHSVHHSDTDIDFTTTYRHHPVETLMMQAVMLPVVLLLAAPVSVVAAHQALSIFANIWGHANIYLPRSVDKALRLFLVTPDFHRLHHCSNPEHTNSNYAAVTTWFDYLFGTASWKPFDEQRTMEVGLERFRERSDSRLDQLLLAPFTGFREPDAVKPDNP